jgi:hypothetical protein
MSYPLTDCPDGDTPGGRWRCEMGSFDLIAVFRAIQKLTWSQPRELMVVLQATQATDAVRTVAEDRLRVPWVCPHCHDPHVVRNGMTRGLQR